MKKPIPSVDERKRTEVPEELKFLNILPDKVYDDLSFLASQVCETPIAFISLNHLGTQQLKSVYGADADEIKQVGMFLEHTAQEKQQFFEVCDTVIEDKFLNQSIKQNKESIRFYAGVPLINSEGSDVGMICVMDRKPNRLNEDQKKALASVSRQVIVQVDLSRVIKNQSEREFEIKKDTELLELSQSLASLGHWVVDLKEGSVFWSAETRAIHEVDESYEPNLSEGINFYDELSRPIIAETIELAIKEKKGWDVKLGIWTAKGNHKWVRATGKVYLEEGKVTKLFGVFQDITEEKIELDKLLQRENSISELNSDLEGLIQEKTIELKRTKKSYQELYDNAPDMMLSIDVKTKKVIECNAKLLNTLGFEKTEFIGKTLKEIYHKKDHSKLNKVLKSLIEKKKVDDERLTILTKDGNKIPISLSATTVANENGEVISTNSIWRDITELVKAENLLKKANSMLEQRVFERTLELKKAKSELEEFTYIATHDLKSPLASIKGHLEIIEAEIESSNETIKRSLFWINDSINLAEYKIQSITDVARLKLEDSVNREEINLFGLIRKVKSKLTQDINNKIKNFKIRAETDVTLVSNKQYLETVLNNLIHNAVKYKREEVDLSISIEIKQDENFFRILVSDNGLGIDLTKDKDRLFKMFSRLHDHVEGAGMGLYFSKKMIEHLGGKIEINSQLGEGSTFTIILPKLAA